jgi:hypothetical protein
VARRAHRRGAVAADPRRGVVIPGGLGTQEWGGVALGSCSAWRARAATLWLLKRGRELVFDGAGLVYLSGAPDSAPAPSTRWCRPRRSAPRDSPFTRLGLGLAAVGRPGYINLGRERDLPGVRTPRALYARSADLLDAAARGGHPLRRRRARATVGRRSSSRAGSGTRAVPPDACTIGTKWGYRYTAAGG